MLITRLLHLKAEGDDLNKRLDRPWQIEKGSKGQSQPDVSGIRTDVIDWLGRVESVLERFNVETVDYWNEGVAGGALAHFSQLPQTPKAIRDPLTTQRDKLKRIIEGRRQPEGDVSEMTWMLRPP